MSPPTARMFGASMPLRSAISTSSSSTRSNGMTPCSRLVSTRWPPPPRWRASSAAEMPCTAPCAATWAATGRAANTGPPRRSWRSKANIRPLRAAMAPSYPGTSASGPDDPHPVMDACTTSGWRARVASASMPQRRARDGGPDTTSTSAVATSAPRSSRAAGWARSSSTLRLPRSHSGAAASARKRSPPGRSTLMTSAPKSARTMVAMPPTGPVVTSTTRNPSNTCGMPGSYEGQRATPRPDRSRVGGWLVRLQEAHGLAGHDRVRVLLEHGDAAVTDLVDPAVLVVVRQARGLGRGGEALLHDGHVAVGDDAAHLEGERLREVEHLADDLAAEGVGDRLGPFGPGDRGARRRDPHRVGRQQLEELRAVSLAQGGVEALDEAPGALGGHGRMFPRAMAPAPALPPAHPRENVDGGRRTCALKAAARARRRGPRRRPRSCRRWPRRSTRSPRPWPRGWRSGPCG